MKLYRVYGYVDFQVKAENEDEALDVFEEECLFDIMDVMNVEEVE